MKFQPIREGNISNGNLQIPKEYYNVDIVTGRFWRYQRSNKNPHFGEEQATQWPKEKVQNDKQWSAKHTYKIKDRVTRIPLKTGGKSKLKLW